MSTNTAPSAAAPDCTPVRDRILAALRGAGIATTERAVGGGICVAGLIEISVLAEKLRYSDRYTGRVVVNSETSYPHGNKIRPFTERDEDKAIAAAIKTAQRAVELRAKLDAEHATQDAADNARRAKCADAQKRADAINADADGSPVRATVNQYGRVTLSVDHTITEADIARIVALFKPAARPPVTP